jgi:hypothetical protein
MLYFLWRKIMKTATDILLITELLEDAHLLAQAEGNLEHIQRTIFELRSLCRQVNSDFPAINTDFINEVAVQVIGNNFPKG